MNTRRMLTLAGCALLLVACQQQSVILGAAILGFPDPNGSPFIAFKLIERTFTEGSSVVTQTYDPRDLNRVPRDIDFNGDGSADPVVGYGGDQAVVQILLSQADQGPGIFLSLTLDSLDDMEDLSAVAVGDINNDQRLDVVAGTSTGVWYLRHPIDARGTTDLRYWNISRIDSSTALVALDDAAILAIVNDFLPPGASILDYEIVVDSRFTNVQVADINLDGHADIVASRFFQIVMTPVLGGGTLETIIIVQGDIAVFFNPGNAQDGTGWSVILLGEPERDAAGRFDRDGANGLFVIDLDRDGDFDIVSAARTDNNVQVAWFENPGTALVHTVQWVQWRIGSVRDAFSIDVADLTGDGLPDVVATGSESLQVYLFPQPASGAKREYDWDTHVIATFSSYKPRHIKITDYDEDGVLELIVGASKGAIRRFDPGDNPLDTWIAGTIMTFEEEGDIGSIGPADCDGDDDPDFIVVINAKKDNDEFVAYIRNDS